MSYFLWSSMPDAELLAHQQPVIESSRGARCSSAPHAQGFAIQNFAREFGGHWLEFRRFEDTTP